MNITFSIIIPVYNSAGILPNLYERIVSTMEDLGEPFEIVFVEDCGPDHAWSVLQKLVHSDDRVVAIQLMRNSGQGSATLAGMEQSSGEFIITMDDDLQHPPEELPKLIKSIRDDENIDVIIGVPQVSMHSTLRKYGSYIVNKLNTFFLNKTKNLRFSGFRILRKNISDALLMFNIPYPALGPMIVNTTPRVKNIAFKHEKRTHGGSNYSFRKLLEQFISNFIGYSVLPLHILAFLGIIGVMFSAITGLFLLYKYIFIGISVPGWTTLLLVLLTLTGFTFLAFSIIGEYLLRINQVSTNVSRWKIRKKINTVKNPNSNCSLNDK